MKVGHEQTSCTQEVEAVTTVVDGETVTLIDTPGFDDTSGDSSKILRSIAMELLDKDVLNPMAHEKSH